MSRLVGRIARALGLSTMLLFITAIGLAPSASATTFHAVGPTTSCDSPLNDLTTNSVVSSNGAVMAAVNKLAGKVTLHVVVYDGTPNGSSTAYVKDLLMQCPQWTLDDPTRVAPNVVLVVMDLHHHITVLDGANHNSKLGPEISSIISRSRSSYDNGDYAGGLTTMLKGIYGTLYPSYNLFVIIAVVIAIIWLLGLVSGLARGGDFIESFFWWWFILEIFDGSGGSPSYGSSSARGFSGSI